MVIQKTNDEQLLLNLVRLKHRDTPLFLEITNVTSRFSFRANAKASAIFPNTGLNIFELNSGGELEESPVVTYSPLQGRKFIQQFLSKISIETIYLLYKSGWSIERILRLCFEKMGSLENAPNASGPTPKLAPHYEEFLQIANSFRKLQKSNALDISIQEDKNILVLIFEIKSIAKEWEEVKEINRLLQTPVTNFYFKFSVNGKIKDHIPVETRSLLGIMYYLSHAIEASFESIDKGYVTSTKDESGNNFSWNELTGNLLRIFSSSQKPDNASIVISYDDYWYFVKKSDLNSKSTFSLLGQIYYLQAGTFESNSPLLTIPVGR